MTAAHVDLLRVPSSTLVNVPCASHRLTADSTESKASQRVPDRCRSARLLRPQPCPRDVKRLVIDEPWPSSTSGDHSPALARSVHEMPLHLPDVRDVEGHVPDALTAPGARRSAAPAGRWHPRSSRSLLMRLTGSPTVIRAITSRTIMQGVSPAGVTGVSSRTQVGRLSSSGSPFLSPYGGLPCGRPSPAAESSPRRTRRDTHSASLSAASPSAVARLRSSGTRGSMTWPEYHKRTPAFAQASSSSSQSAVTRSNLLTSHAATRVTLPS